MRGSAPAEARLATPDLCVYCFDVLVNTLGGDTPPPPPFEDGKSALFVTWTKRGRLRGCIGTLEPRRLHSAVKDYALTSALRDTRFSPIRSSEVQSLSCAVSLLGGFTQAAHLDDWEVGVHGLVAKFPDPDLGGSQRTATFLPEVAAEQGWSRGDTVEALVRKAGYQGPITPGLLATVRLTRYTSSKASASYGQYQAAARARRESGEQGAGLEPAASEAVVVYA